MFRVKICGVTRPQDVRLVAKAGADAIGFQMSQGPRKITPDRAKKLIKLVPPYLTPVGVFVNEPLAKVKKLIKFCGFQVVQLHGDENAAYCEQIHVPVMKVIRMKNQTTYRAYKKYKVAAFLLDSFHKGVRGGTGKSFEHTWAKKAVAELSAPVLLAGGLNPEKVQKAIRASKVFGVDVASGVEITPGIKDPKKVPKFVANAKKALKKP
jgi:phosphoribosylanthranilate isomerase